MSGNEKNNSKSNSSGSSKDKTPSPIKKFLKTTNRVLRSGGKGIQIALDARGKFGNASRKLFGLKNKQKQKTDENNQSDLNQIDEAAEAIEGNLIETNEEEIIYDEVASEEEAPETSNTVTQQKNELHGKIAQEITNKFLSKLKTTDKQKSTVSFSPFVDKSYWQDPKGTTLSLSNQIELIELRTPQKSKTNSTESEHDGDTEEIAQNFLLTRINVTTPETPEKERRDFEKYKKFTQSKKQESTQIFNKTTKDIQTAAKSDKTGFLSDSEELNEYISQIFGREKEKVAEESASDNNEKNDKEPEKNDIDNFFDQHRERIIIQAKALENNAKKSANSSEKGDPNDQRYIAINHAITQTEKTQCKDKITQAVPEIKNNNTQTEKCKKANQEEQIREILGGISVNSKEIDNLREFLSQSYYEEEKEEEMDYLTVKKVIRDIKPLENTNESYTTFTKACKFAHAALKPKFDTHDGMEKTFIDQLALLLSSELQGSIHSEEVQTFDQFLDILRNAHGYTQMSNKWWHQLASFKPLRGESLRALKLRLKGIRGQYAMALKEEGRSSEEIARDVNAIENQLVQVLPQFLPSPFNQLMATENVRTMEQFDKFLDKHGEINYGSNSNQGATCMMIRQNEMEKDQELTIINILQQSLKAIDTTVANAQRENEKKFAAINEKLLKFEEKMTHNTQHRNTNDYSQRPFNGNRNNNQNFANAAGNNYYNNNYGRANSAYNVNQQAPNARNAYNHNAQNYNAYNSKNNNNSYNRTRRNSWGNQREYNQGQGQSRNASNDNMRNTSMNGSRGNVSYQNDQRNVSFNDNVESFPSFREKN